jgi:hypothetical protein
MLGNCSEFNFIKLKNAKNTAQNVAQIRLKRMVKRIVNKVINAHSAIISFIVL